MKRIIIVFLLMVFSNSLWAQDWVRADKKNKWGEIESYTYNQIVVLATANYKGKNSTVAVIFMVDPTQPDIFIIGSRRLNGLDIHPAANFIDASITITLRNKEGKEFTYIGMIPSTSDFTNVIMGVPDADLIKLLKTNGEWDILIEGRDWYIRSKIKGNLPL